jgi:hypothetical protein
VLVDGRPARASDITDLAFVEAVARLSTAFQPALICWLADEFMLPEKVVRAKGRRVARRGLVTGCWCGCRGDVVVTPTGREVLAVKADLEERLVFSSPPSLGKSRTIKELAAAVDVLGTVDVLTPGHYDFTLELWRAEPQPVTFCGEEIHIRERRGLEVYWLRCVPDTHALRLERRRHAHWRRKAGRPKGRRRRRRQ